MGRNGHHHRGGNHGRGHHNEEGHPGRHFKGGHGPTLRENIQDVRLRYHMALVKDCQKNI